MSGSRKKRVGNENPNAVAIIPPGEAAAIGKSNSLREERKNATKAIANVGAIHGPRVVATDIYPRINGERQLNIRVGKKYVMNLYIKIFT